MPSSGSGDLCNKAQADQASFVWDRGSDTGQYRLTFSILSLPISSLLERGIQFPYSANTSNCEDKLFKINPLLW